MTTVADQNLMLQFEGLQALDFQFARSTADVRIAGYDLTEAQTAQVEAFLTSSPPRRKRSEVEATRVAPTKRRGFTVPWKKKAAPVLYQATTQLVTVALATSALAFPRIASEDVPRAVIPTPVHHFASSPNDEGAITATPIQKFALTERLASDDASGIPGFDIEELLGWPPPSAHPTTPASARALRNATREDPTPTLPPLVIDDGFGI